MWPADAENGRSADTLFGREGARMLGPSKPAWNIEALDRAQWERIRDDVGAETLLRYAGLYLDLLADRIEAIEQAVVVGDVEHAQRVLVDLRTSSSMLGVEKLARAAAAAEGVLRQSTCECGGVDLRELRDEANTAVRALIWAIRQLPEPTRPALADQWPIGE
jgi:HPt (histidine-containing phosphotransfer) domain-containing protein